MTRGAARRVHGRPGARLANLAASALSTAELYEKQIELAEQAEASPASARQFEDIADLRLAVAEYEKEILVAALERCRWNQRAAAQALSLTYDQLRHAMRRHELQGS